MSRRDLDVAENTDDEQGYELGEDLRQHLDRLPFVSLDGGFALPQPADRSRLSREEATLTGGVGRGFIEAAKPKRKQEAMSA